MGASSYMRVAFLARDAGRADSNSAINQAHIVGFSEYASTGSCVLIYLVPESSGP